MERKLERVAGKLAAFFEKHWLALFNLGFGLYVALAVLAPVMMHLGHPGAAKPIYKFYSFLCHQLPERSYFLFGKGRLVSVYSLPWLEASGYIHTPSILVRRAFIGNGEIGYKMAFCQRCFAIYSTFFLSGIAFGLTGRRWRGLSLKAYIFFLLPLGIDGGLQAIGLHQSTWLLRTITGAMFAGATVWMVYPVLQQGTTGSSRDR